MDYIREAKKGETPRNVRLYDEQTRRQIDRMVTDRAVDYISQHAKGDRPFFLYVPFAFAHHPALAHPDFKGKSPAGEFGDSLLEHDHNVGRLLDALTAGGIADNTVVIWASDNGPSPLPTVTPWWTIGDAGPWRGEIGTVLEGNIRTSCLLRWPGHIPAGGVSNQIVSAVDLFPTLARIAGGKVPTDRPIDGVDQLDFFTGRREASDREHVLLFLGQRLMAVKWRNYKMHLDGLDRVDGVFEDWSFRAPSISRPTPRNAGTSSGRTAGSVSALARSSPPIRRASRNTPISRRARQMTRCPVMAKKIPAPKQALKACNTSWSQSGNSDRSRSPVFNHGN